MNEVRESSKCKYEQEYYDYISKKSKIFRCDEDAVKDGYCIFHHPEYWKEHRDKVREKFMYKVEDAIKNKKELLCIGYNLPEIVLLQKKFAMPVYFNYAVFHEKAYFLRIEFSDYANFNRTEFSETVFIEAKFSKVEFIDAKFFGGTAFDFSTFLGRVG